MKEVKRNKNRLVNEFTQKRGFNYRKFHLYHDKVIIETKTIRKIEKYEVKIDNIGFDILYQADNVIIGKIVMFICILIPILLVFLNLFNGQDILAAKTIMIFMVCWGFALINYSKQHQDDIILKGHQNLEFYRSIPNEDEVLEFISLIVSSSKSYLKKKYYKLKEHSNEVDLQNTMTWLLDREVISESEFDKIMNDFHLRKSFEFKNTYNA